MNERTNRAAFVTALVAALVASWILPAAASSAAPSSLRPVATGDSTHDEERAEERRLSTALEAGGDAAAWQRLAFLRFRLGDLAGANVALDRSDAIESADARSAYTAYLRGVVAETALDLGAADAAYREALRRAPQHADAASSLDALASRAAAVARFAAARDDLDRDTWLVGIAALVACGAAFVAVSRRASVVVDPVSHSA